jgi:hypothetical protein
VVYSTTRCCLFGTLLVHFLVTLGPGVPLELAAARSLLTPVYKLSLHSQFWPPKRRDFRGKVISDTLEWVAMPYIPRRISLDAKRRTLLSYLQAAGAIDANLAGSLILRSVCDLRIAIV